MRNRLFFLIVLVGMVSGCGNGVGAWSVSHSKGDSVVGKDSIGDVLPRWKTLDTPLVFAGVWVNELYVEKLGVSKSPVHCQDVAASCIEIPDSTLEATSMVSGFHEGGETRVIVKKGDRYQFYNSELTEARDEVEPMGADRLRIGKNYFRRLKHPNMKRSDWGILEELLFGGKFVRLPEGSEVVFDEQGQVKGLPGVSVYEPQIDYMGTEYGDLDLIDMGEADKGLVHYTFRFAGDTLKIYSIDSTSEGKEMWTLRKVN